jgi:hypothetical protein
VRGLLEPALGRDLGGVRVHEGPMSALAAGSLRARAYTLGRDVHLGAEAHRLGSAERLRLLAHEAVHTVQQGGGRASPDGPPEIADPGGPEEAEARRIGAAVTSGPGPVRFPAVSRLTSPRIQRDLVGSKPEWSTYEGDFLLNLKTRSDPGVKTGMEGTITFQPSPETRDSFAIRLLQTLRVEDLGTGREYRWKGSFAPRRRMRTQADRARGIEPGYAVDVNVPRFQPRAADSDPDVSPYYGDSWDLGGGVKNQDGHKIDDDIKPAAIYDFPGVTGLRPTAARLTFETVARGDDVGYDYAALRWGFTVSNTARGTVTREHAKANAMPSATFGTALEKFDRYYRNPPRRRAPVLY